jgi:hypothetical protein
LSWRHTRRISASGEKQLQVVLDDLYPWTTDEFLTKLGRRPSSSFYGPP